MFERKIFWNTSSNNISYFRGSLFKFKTVELLKNIKNGKPAERNRQSSLRIFRFFRPARSAQQLHGQMRGVPPLRRLPRRESGFCRGNTKDTKVLDFACGTGLVAAAMVTRGFEGEIYGLDGSGGMLGMARKKGIYRNLKEKIVVPGTRLDYEDCSFDGVFNCGGFAVDQLQPGVIPELLRVVKRDGVVVMTTRYNDPPMEYQEKFDSQVKVLEEEGLWRKASLEKAHYFNCDYYNKDQPLIATIYCYLKS